MPRPDISLEFFPPKSLEASFRLWDTVQTLSPLGPRFVSVTYGAGGTTRELTRDAVKAIHKQSGLRTAAHLTCVNATREETLEIARGFWDVGVRDIVALRGDPPKGEDRFTPTDGGFQDSCELIEGLKAERDFTIRVGAYPDVHPNAGTQQDDVDYLKRKFDAGADEALTQFFFEAETFFRFRDACEKAGIDKPIVPGIFPVENWKGARRFAEACGTKIPQWVIDAFETAERDGRSDLLATSLCTELCSDLIEGGVDKLHFYTLNKPELTRDVCHAIGVTPETRLENVA
ncbi:5,10-methylenetetrahydrofolate reductase [Roseivivax halodurans JCM 10272]|uniref:Methylenetetrahydrofolate reductase n=1 Tax=Roseivivax halodurans JCM 10272 TaxID=1449350 RepID=X7EJ33_9RHOB|nr:methylenetetrahydrofolate reductase [NAD(P)H] [Roseivivax halodurans]ETX16129.1 5,10-methylenetetrahydrofolate reductase [Roseivivax halodurans JCM 10272]